MTQNMLGSPLLNIGFTALPLAACAVLLLQIRRTTDAKVSRTAAIVAALWLLLTFGLAKAGVLDRWTLPPPIVVVFALGFVLAGLLARGRIGRGLATLPQTFLIGAQGFRVVAELSIHQAVTENVAPPQLTWSPGLNFDIVTGVVALVLLPFANRAPRWLLLMFNALGASILTVVVVVALLSAPTPFQQITPDNTWVAHAPYIWLPTVLVVVAFALHAISVRALLFPATDDVFDAAADVAHEAERAEERAD